MARAAAQQAKQDFNNSQSTFNQANADSSKFGSNADQIGATLTPQLESEAANPQGYGDSAVAKMNTGIQQGTGGAIAGAVGEDGLDAERTGNRGAMQGALDESAREGMRTNSDAALKIGQADADLKAKQQQAALSGLGQLYDQNSSDELNALNAENGSTNAGNSSINAELASGQSGWFQNMTGFMNALGNDGMAAAKLGVKVCWIAAELYGGWEDHRTMLIHSWLNDEVSKSRTGRAGVALYQRFGESVAAMVRSNKIVRAVFFALFEGFLKKARKWEQERIAAEWEISVNGIARRIQGVY